MRQHMFVILADNILILKELLMLKGFYMAFIGTIWTIKYRLSMLQST